MKKTESSTRYIQSVKRAMMIIEFIANNNNLAGITEISHELGLGKSTIYGLVSTLEQMHYLRQDIQSGKYALSIKFIDLGNVVCSSMDLRTIARPFLQKIVNKYHETVHLAVLSEKEVVYIDKVDSVQPLSVGIISRVGGRNPAYCTGVGKVLLADLPEERLDVMLQHFDYRKYTQNTIVDYKILKKHLIDVKKNGYAMDNEEIEIGLSCVAVPIRNYRGKTIAALSLSAPTGRMPTDVTSLKDELITEGNNISFQLGYNEK